MSALALKQRCDETIAKARARMGVIPYEKRYEAQVLAMAHAMARESVSYCDMPIDDAKLVSHFEAAGRPNTLLYAKICVKDDEVLGGFFGVISPVYFGRTLTAKDLAWFVKPSARGSCAAVALIADFEEWVASHGVKHIFISQSTGVQIDATKALYERLGYRTLGASTMKRI